MKLRSFLLKRKTFISWLSSYILILMIPVLISIIVYLQAGKVVEGEVLQANSLLLNQVRQIADSRISDIDSLAAQVILDGRVSSLINAKGDFTPNQKLTLADLRSFMRSLKTANGFADDVYIFFKTQQSVLNSDSYSDSDTMFRIIHGNSGLLYDQWKEMMQGNYMKQYIPLFTDNKSQDKVFAFVQSLPVRVPENSTATLAVIIRQSKFIELINNIKWLDKGTAVILDKDNNVLASTKNLDLPDSLQYESLKGERGLKYDTINGEKVVVSYIKSNISDLKYISIIPNGVFWEKAGYIRNITLFGILLFVVIGAIAAYYITKRNYKPLGGLLQGIATNLGLTYESGGSEFKFIQETIDVTLDEKEKITRKVKQQNSVLKSYFLAKLLNGMFDKGELTEENLLAYDICFSTGYFAVMLFKIDDFKGLFLDETVKAPEDRIKLVKFIIKNIVEELLEADNRGFMVEVDNNMLACIVNFNKPADDREAAKKYLIQTADTALNFIESRFKISFSAALSNCHQQLSGISKAYIEAFDAMENMILVESKGIIHCDDAKLTKYRYTYSIETEFKMINLIKEGNFSNASNLLNEVFDSNFSNPSLSTEMGRCLIFDLISTVIKIADNASYTSFLEELQPVNRLMNCATLVEMKNVFNDILRLICEYFAQENERKGNSQFSADVIGFIKEKYNDPNFSINMVAQYFNITPNYLSVLFKQQSGEGLHDYVEKVRLLRAKQLLEIPGMSIIDVAKEVGYNNSRSFIRVFKKYEGITPGKFKKIS